MNYVISLLPIALYLLLIKGMDGFSLAKRQKIIECAMWGLFSCLICLDMGKAFDLSGATKIVKGFPLFEEIVKALPLIVAIYKNRSAFFAEALIYGATVGAGFSFTENILYVYWNPEFSLGDAFMRGIGTSLLHIGCTALVACMALVFHRIAKDKKMPQKVLFGALSYIPSIAIHFLYNMFLLPEFVQMIITVVIYIGLFILVYNIDEALIHKWLDLCISNDITLYTSMKKGELQNTNAGQYLLMAKKRFQPEEFFDICVYLGLYLEMSIAAKSRMIMKESGMEIPLSEEQHRANMDKITELKALRKSIGTSGILLLRPFVNAKAADEWAMAELL